MATMGEVRRPVDRKRNKRRLFGEDGGWRLEVGSWRLEVESKAIW